ncbi:hypothetical protein I5M32_01845 [Pedobacter sp. SD-b]|uniref:Tetratricopeptide repeat-containing protein n=1 Tax=Pedobacter segetis TaxID=2793069 RepID=A0ABS1BFR4_9SPHI|nr:hypothetical protein [Pedobacter segetis]MBK0381691.1 hypothetical protein [Pedobacter segetis]
MKKDDELFKDLQNLMGSQNFKNEKDLEKFFNQFMSNELTQIKNGNTIKNNLAEDIVQEAYGLDEFEAKEAAAEALMLDDKCIAAYELLATIEGNPFISLVFLEKAIGLGKEKFGGKYLKENKGYFWGLHETRPYMRCLQAYAECLYLIGKTKESIAVLEEMLVLNPNDNQGIRDFLLLYLIEDGQPLKFIKYDKMFEEDTMAFASFNRALFAFKTEGDNENSVNKLKQAIKENNHIVKLLLAKKDVEDVPSSYSIGSKDEADFYTFYAKPVWQNIEGALDWLRSNNRK